MKGQNTIVAAHNRVVKSSSFKEDFAHASKVIIILDVNDPQ